MLPTDNPQKHLKQPLITPEILRNQLNLSPKLFQQIKANRQITSNIIDHSDNRLLVIIGPCSIHDLDAAQEYAERLIKAALYYQDDLHIIMRTYFEKPRTTVGWKGLINDPFLDGSFDINHGLFLARQLLIELNKNNMPVATEFVDPFLHNYLSELVTWGCIGARTVESQIHRELTSGLPMPIGFKNSTDGNVKVAIDAIHAAKLAHTFPSINDQGIPFIVTTKGNHACHLVLRGSQDSPNYSQHHVHQAASIMQKSGLRPSLLIDCSHGNSMKNYSQQQKVALDVAKQLKDGSTVIRGIMLESHLMEGKQELTTIQNLTYGQSITDGCLGWDESLKILDLLALAKRQRTHLIHTTTPLEHQSQKTSQ